MEGHFSPIYSAFDFVTAVYSERDRPFFTIPRLYLGLFFKKLKYLQGGITR
ncbi:hypothetical protein SAMN05443253_104189 [Bacillus sp. OK048]|nr:hypothetical protein SAMN05443253_104189 [Bacillus sp. OK048]